MIAFPCPKCRAPLKAPDDAVGGRTNCPRCGSPLQVPNFSVSDPPAVGDPPIVPDVLQPRDDEIPYALPVQEKHEIPFVLPVKNDVPTLAEAHVYVLLGHEKRGPYVETQLRAMWNAGGVTADALYWREGMTGWEPLSKLFDAPKRSTLGAVKYNSRTDTFNGTLRAVMKLAIRAAQSLGYRIDNANETLGILTFQTEITWGSWSGALCSLSFHEIRSNTFEVIATGEQNLAGGQIFAIDFGEAKSRAQKVVDKMGELAG